MLEVSKQYFNEINYINKMKKMTKIKPLLIVATIMMLTSCSLFNKISAPNHNAITYQLAVSADSTMNSLYTGFSNGSDLNYDESSAVYEAVEELVNEKISLDSTRKYPTQILALDKVYLEVVESSKQDHKADVNISVNHINVNGALLKQMGDILVSTEKTYK